MGNYSAAWKKYATFSGRATRAEFWTFVLINWAISIVLYIPAFATADRTTTSTANGMFASFNFGPLVILPIVWGLAILIPSLAVAWRRLHDTDRSGGWYFMFFLCGIGGIVPFIFWLLPGTQGPNKFGAPAA